MSTAEGSAGSSALSARARLARRGHRREVLGIAITRVLRAGLVAFGVLVVSFLLVRMVPGDPAVALCDLCGPEDLERFRRELGLGGSIVEQFASYLGGVVRLDLGHSLRSGRGAIEVISERLPVSVGLISLTLVFTLVVAVPVGLAAAIYRDRAFGHVVRVASAALIAMPSFFTAVLFIIVGGVWLRIAPISGYVAGIPESLYYLWLPALVLTVAISPIMARLLQQSITDTMGEEFVEAAVSRGLPSRLIVWGYLLRPSLGPTIAILGSTVATLIGSAVMVELVFNLPGIGYTLIDAILARDYPVVQGLVLVIGVAVVVINTLAELLSKLIDPRLRRGAS